MRTVLYTLIGILGCLQSCFAGPEGLWGGKWDDKWTVFLKVEPGADANSYKVHYFWHERVEDESFSKNVYPVKQVGAYFEAGPLMIFKVEGDKGMLYGAFKTPRMANLVKINSELPSVSESDRVLRKHQWKEAAIPASEALEKIKGHEETTVNGQVARTQQSRATGPQDDSSLGEFLVGTKWLWYGSPKNAMTFKEDGTIGFPNWTDRGLVTGWIVTGESQVKLSILKGRTNNMTATLNFAKDRSSFTGIDFNGSSAIAKSPRVP